MGSNRFPAYVKLEEKEGEKGETQTTTVETDEKVKPQMRVCEPRKMHFKVPSLVELCTRRLLEPINASRELGSPTVATKSKLFTPGMSNASSGSIRRNFHTVKDSMDIAALPTHLLKPFLSLLHPLPPHLRCLLTPSQSPSTMSQTNNILPGTPSSTVAGNERTPGTPSLQNLSISTPLEAMRDIPQCSRCKTPCSQFAETRIEWRSEIAGVQLGKADDERCWIPVLWRGCKANCLDFLDEPLE